MTLCVIQERGPVSNKSLARHLVTMTVVYRHGWMDKIVLKVATRSGERQCLCINAKLLAAGVSNH